MNRLTRFVTALAGILTTLLLLPGTALAAVRPIGPDDGEAAVPDAYAAAPPTPAAAGHSWTFVITVAGVAALLLGIVLTVAAARRANRYRDGDRPRSPLLGT